MRFERRCALPVRAAEAYQWHMRPGAFERLSPPWQDVRVLEQKGRPSEAGYRVVLSVPLGPFRRSWVAEHREIREGTSFQDVQVDGPFSRWQHTHRFLPDGSASTLVDEVDFEMPFRPIGSAAASWVEDSLERLFDYRHRTTRGDLSSHRAYPDLERLRVLVTGAGGLIGATVVPFLTTGGHDVVRLVRREPRRENEIRWDPSGGGVAPGSLEGFDVVVHLAGESIASGRWSPKRKARIRESRSRGTAVLAEALASLRDKPRVLVSASAVGVYGDRGDHVLDETSPPGEGFLAEVCQDWERATDPAARAGIRVVHLRFGVVLSPRGGALQKMLLPFRLGLGGPVGTGRQRVSFVAIDEIPRILLHVLANHSLEGAVNVVTPEPVLNRELSATLGRVLRRPSFLPLPGIVARAALGEMAEELLLASTGAVPRKLLESGYEFQYPDLRGALSHLLGVGGTM